MRPLKLVVAALIGIAAIVLVATGFVVVAAIGAAVVLFLWVRKLITGKSPNISFKANIQRGRAAATPPRNPSAFRPEDAIDIEASTVKEPPKSLSN